MIVHSNTKSIASATNFPEFLNLWSDSLAKIERCCFISFFTHQVFHKRWKTPWKTQKRCCRLFFYIVEKSFAFQQRYYLFYFSKDKKKDLLIKKCLKFPPWEGGFDLPQSFSQFSLFHKASFQEFPQQSIASKVLHKIQKVFRALSPHKINDSKPKKPSPFLAFSHFSKLSTKSKTNTPKL